MEDQDMHCRLKRRPGTIGLIAIVALLAPQNPLFAAGDDQETALQLANMLRAARNVVAAKQDLINDPTIADKGLTGDLVLGETLTLFEESTGLDPQKIDPESRLGRLLKAQMSAIVEVIDEHQNTINQPDIGFKGFVPAVFARLVNERFQERVGDQAEIKVTAPPQLVRNRKARPDAWETEHIEDELMAPEWPTGQMFATTVSKDGRPAYRMLVPEYYSAGCLDCHGEPQGEIDVTGYPKEGGQLGDLGGVISITLYP
jgi:Protein of unknown function (DUF3365)